MSLETVFSSFSSYRSSQSQYALLASRNERATAANAEEQVDLDSQQGKAATYSAELAQRPATLEGAEGRTQAANTILSFLATRLKADAAEGASTEDMQSRLQAGLDGFVQGYQEAYTQLAEMGFLQAEVEQAIEKTFSDVLDGIELIAEELQISPPATDALREQQSSRRTNYVPPEEPAAAANDAEKGIMPTDLGAQTDNARNLGQLIEASTFDYRKAEARTFNFSLTTQDGDKVTIRAAYASSTIFEGTSANFAEGQHQSVSGSFKAASGLYLRVQGELDAEEMTAIEDLLAQVKQVSDRFYLGDVESAFEQALAMGFDSEQIARFSLKLRYQSASSYQQNYQQYQPAGIEGPGLDPTRFQDEALMMLARFVQALEDMRVKAEELGLSDSQIQATSENADVVEAQRPRSVEIVSDLLTQLQGLSQPQS